VLLRASHIIPWSVSEARRLDPTNGICLNALHDAAFDAGLIGFDSAFHVLLSSATRDAMPKATYEDYFVRYEGKPVRAPKRFTANAEHLRYHLEHVFIS
jgi:predicted restriction endonuclease